MTTPVYGSGWIGYQATVDFGHPTGPTEGDEAVVTVPAVWVTSDMKFICTVVGGTADHDDEDAVVEGITATVEPVSVVPGVSFDVKAYAPEGSWGRYYVNVLGQ